MIKKLGLSYIQRLLIAIVFALILLSAWWTGASLLDLVRTQRALDEAHGAVHVADALLRQVIDAETGQRGYVVAGNSSYLAPYHAAVAEIRQTRLTLERMVVIPKEAETLNALMHKVDEKLLELQHTISLMTAGDQEQALQIIRSGDGKDLMNQIRQAAFEFANLQDLRLRELRQDHANAIDRTYIAMGLSLVSNIGLLILLLARTAVFTRRVQSNQEELHKRNLELIELAQKTKDHNLHMQKLSELGSFLQACIDTEEANKFLAERLPELLNARSGALYAMAASRNQLQLAFFWGNEKYVDFFEPNECWALRSGQPFVQPEGTGASTCKHLHALESIERPGVQCLPIASHGELTGLVILDPTQEEDPLDNFHARLRQTTVEQVALSLGNLRLRESLHQQSIKDALTGLYNRRFLDETLHREILRAERRGLDNPEGALAIMMIDVDHFKQFNDQYGHEIGDRVLCRVAQSLAQTVRSGDLVARYGGEEFTVVLPSATGEVAIERAEELRMAVMQMLPVADRGEIHMPVTISIGVACLEGKGQTAETLIKNADHALYQSKHSGRNKVTLFQQPLLHSSHLNHN